LLRDRSLRDNTRPASGTSIDRSSTPEAAGSQTVAIAMNRHSRDARFSTKHRGFVPGSQHASAFGEKNTVDPSTMLFVKSLINDARVNDHQVHPIE
jgi:hypothetical protein